MVTKLRLLFTTTILFVSFCVSGQGEYWARQNARNSVIQKISKRFDVSKSSVFAFEEDRFKQDLESVSVRGNNDGAIGFPDADGRVVSYRVVESPVLSPVLSKKYPLIKSYTGYSLEKPGEKVRFSVSPDGVQAMFVHSDGRANGFIQKVSDGTYVMYTRDSENPVHTDFECSTRDKLIAESGNLTARPVDGQVLRKYRLAVTATAEYTNKHGGTVAGALAAINATVTRINEVFETDLAVTLELVDDTDKVIYTDVETDPFSGNNLGALGSQGQNTLSEEIGEANYDIGHVFHGGAEGGNAGFIGAICVANRKGSAYASSDNPEGDIFDLDFAAHEMGHQLGANHTWSFESEGTTVQVEPGSGSTIMGYAGITQNDNVQPNGDDYFHYVSIEQIIQNLETKSCGEVVAIANTPPVVENLNDYVIPKSTAFVLTGSATDADVGDVLTYTWEEIDNGVIKRATFGPENPSGANFRSRPPVTEPTRYFPLLSRVVAGNLTQENPAVNSAWETVSTVERQMNFAFTVRDNAAGGGQVVSELNTVLVTNDAGPFSVLSQDTAEIYVAGEVREIAWDVSGTNVAPVNAQSVDIMLSTDGGLTFPVILAEGVRNDGSHDIVIPGIPTNDARIMVKATENVFFAVNASDFTIEDSEVVLDFRNLEFEVCRSEELNIPFTYRNSLGFEEEVTFSVTGAPAGLGVTISPETVNAGDTPVNILLNNTETVPEGNYELTVFATSASIVRQVPLQLTVSDADFPEVTLTAPTDGLDETSIRVPLAWEADPSFTSYEIQIASNAAFTNIVETATVFSNGFTSSGLENTTTYFWRVKPINACGEGGFSTPFSFTTIDFTCETKTASGFPKEISSVGTPSVISKIAFFEDLAVSDINVNLNIDHAYLEDLTVSLTSPSKTIVILVLNSCGNLANLNATFDDDALDFLCGADPDTAITGVVKPSGTLASFNGESILGEWILEVKDNVNTDGGTLNGFSLDICVEGEFRPDADSDGVFDDGDDLCLDTPAGAEVDTSGCPIFRFPIDNFSVSAQSESCRGNNDGAITVDAALTLEIEYDITITGNGTSIADTFVDTFMAPDLPAGTYTVCINGSTTEIDYEEYCFEVVVSQPEPLDVLARLSAEGTEVILSLNGAEEYTISLNGKAIRTSKSEISLDLNGGTNVLKVSTDLSCQGSFEDEIVIPSGATVFPNSFDNTTHLFLGEVEEQVTIAIFSADGQLIRKRLYAPNGNGLTLDFTGLPSGMYVVKFEGENSNGTVKVVKR